VKPLKGLPKQYLAAALISGAAVFACPAHALQCPKYQFWRHSMPVDEAFERMTQFATQKINAAQSVFKGRIVKVESIGSDEEFPTLILTYEIDEWLKGSGQQHATIIHEGWCDGPCPNIQSMMDELQYDDRDDILIASNVDRLSSKDNSKLPLGIDGVFRLCSRTGRRNEPIDKPLLFSKISHRDFLFRVAMEGALEKLSSKNSLQP
jgi:hypothetical protein